MSMSRWTQSEPEVLVVPPALRESMRRQGVHIQGEWEIYEPTGAERYVLEVAGIWQPGTRLIRPRMQ